MKKTNITFMLLQAASRWMVRKVPRFFLIVLAHATEIGCIMHNSLSSLVPDEGKAIKLMTSAGLF